MKLSPRLEKLLAGPAVRDPATEDAVAAIEEELGFEFPADYRAFMLRSNGINIDLDDNAPWLRLDEIETVVDTSYGYSLDVRNQQVVIIGSDGGPHGYCIDFRFETPFFVRMSWIEQARSQFDYLGDSLDAFIGHLEANTKEKKPRGLPKRKKKKLVARKVDPDRGPYDPGLALIARPYETQTSSKPCFDTESGCFLLPASFSVHLLDPVAGEVRQFTEDRNLAFPGAIHPHRRVAVVRAYDHEAHRWTFTEYDLRSGDPETGAPGRRLPEHPHEQPLDLLYTPDGRFLVEVAPNVKENAHYKLDEPEGGICVFDAETLELEQRLFGGRSGQGTVATISPEGHLVHIHARRTGERPHLEYFKDIVWRDPGVEGDDGVVRKLALQDPHTCFFGIAFTPDGTLYGALAESWFCRIHDDGSLSYPLGRRALPTGGAFHLVGDDRVLIGTGAGSLHLFELETGREVWNDRARRGCCDTLCVSPDGRWALTLGMEGATPRLWRLPDG